MLDDSAQRRALGVHSGSFSGGTHSRWSARTQTGSDAARARSSPVDSQHWRAVAHAAAKLSELQNRASSVFSLGATAKFCVEVLTDVANELRDKGVLDEEESFIDATFAMAKGGGAEIGPTKRGKGMKIMAIVDRHGLPLSVSTHAANHHEVRLVQLCFDFYMIEAKPGTLIGDRAYDSDPLDDELRKDGIEMVAPHRSNRRKRATQDGRRLRRYARRWLVERFFAWIQWQRRILVRWEFYPKNFLGFVQLACLLVLFRRF